MYIEKIRKPLNKYISKVSKDINVDEVIVFGSYADGVPTKDSDVDVVVISNDFKKLNTRRRLDLLDAASYNIEPSIVAAGFTSDEFKKVGELSMLGQVGENGVRVK